MDLFFGLKQFFLGSLVGEETFVWPLHKQNSDHSLPKIEVSWCQQSFSGHISQHWPDLTILTLFNNIGQILKFGLNFTKLNRSGCFHRTWIFLLTFPAVWICISQSHTTTGACDVSVQDGANRGQLDEESGDIELFSCFFCLCVLSFFWLSKQRQTNRQRGLFYSHLLMKVGWSVNKKIITS